ncbi:Zinc finger, GRF-type [Sesbania bispinosa]|nr:Zinc finger, GRF-type [Sesbania bispinosa]
MDGRRKMQRTSGTRGRPSASMSCGSSSQSRSRTCNCGDELLLLTSKTASNPGRVFWRCPNWERNSSCNFFRWADEEVLQEEGTSEPMHFVDHQTEETIRKNWKLQKKLGAEKAKAKYLFWLLVVSWVVTLGVILTCALKCGCIR